jgi:allantoin racemase
MQILVINPNTTASMTAQITAAARSVAAPGTTVIGANPSMGPASIEGYYDEAFSVPGLLDEIRKGEHQGCDGFVIACFDDTGLDAARCIATGPVVGICEAAVSMASMLCTRFSIITTLSRSLPALCHLAQRYGVADRCSIRASDIPVLDLEADAGKAHDTIAQHIGTALDEDGAEAVVLGCAGMTKLANNLSQQFSVPVLDGVVCAVKQVESLVALKLQTSKHGGYAYPLAKTYSGQFSDFAPK